MEDEKIILRIKQSKLRAISFQEAIEQSPILR